MNRLLDYPLVLFVFSFITFWLSTFVGASVFRERRKLEHDVREDFGTILASTLTLNALIIGFTFSMSMGRYEQRKNYEVAEANAISTEILRVDLLAAADATHVRSLLKLYADQRVLFYTERGENMIQKINRRTAELQAELWSASREAAVAVPAILGGLVIDGMNQVFDSQGNTQASWWNRIPVSAWILMGAIAIICHLLVGYGTENVKAERVLMMVLPMVVSTSFLLIADIDSPRSGIIRVVPQNLYELVAQFHAR
jgi:hypothetical protein